MQGDSMQHRVSTGRIGYNDGQLDKGMGGVCGSHDIRSVGMQRAEGTRLAACVYGSDGTEDSGQCAVGPEGRQHTRWVAEDWRLCHGRASRFAQRRVFRIEVGDVAEQ